MDARTQKEALKKGLDYRIAVAEANLKHERFTINKYSWISDVSCVYESKNVSVFISHVEEACRILNIPYNVIDRQDEDYPYEKYFMYK